jgi:hypothetical protein
MNMVRITQAVPLEGLRVRLTLTDGQVVERDLSRLLIGPVFQSVRSDPATFGAMKVRRGTLVWPGDVDLCPDTILASE